MCFYCYGTEDVAVVELAVMFQICVFCADLFLMFAEIELAEILELVIF